MIGRAVQRAQVVGAPVQAAPVPVAAQLRHQHPGQQHPRHHALKVGSPALQGVGLSPAAVERQPHRQAAGAGGQAADLQRRRGLDLAGVAGAHHGLAACGFVEQVLAQHAVDAPGGFDVGHRDILGAGRLGRSDVKARVALFMQGSIGLDLGFEGISLALGHQRGVMHGPQRWIGLLGVQCLIVTVESIAASFPVGREQRLKALQHGQVVGHLLLEAPREVGGVTLKGGVGLGLNPLGGPPPRAHAEGHPQDQGQPCRAGVARRGVVHRGRLRVVDGHPASFRCGDTPVTTWQNRLSATGSRT